MDFEKWVNELQCEIDKIKRKLAALSGGGSTVSITPTLESGTKVADYMIDETSGAIYAPEQVNADWNAASGAARILNKPAEIMFDSFTFSGTIGGNTRVEIDIDNDIRKQGYNIKIVCVYSQSSTIMPTIEYSISDKYYILARNFDSSSSTTNFIVHVIYEEIVTTRTTKKKK